MYMYIKYRFVTIFLCIALSSKRVSLVFNPMRKQEMVSTTILATPSSSRGLVVVWWPKTFLKMFPLEYPMLTKT